MHKIGITGGVGAGKSMVLSYLEQRYGAVVIRTDELARDLVLAGTELNVQLHRDFPEEVFLPDGNMDRAAMAHLIYTDPEERERLDALIHPAVKTEVMNIMEKLEDEGETEIFILEAALLIEEHYDQILDELWYIDADPEIRRERLRESRGYSDEKINGIMKSQLSEEEFSKACDAVISNNRSKEETYQEIDEEIKRIRHHLVV